MLVQFLKDSEVYGTAYQLGSVVTVSDTIGRHLVRSNVATVLRSTEKAVQIRAVEKRCL
jgi:hypothetical protein